ncbi:hypothetical protein [Neotabrizicola sp. VNH66]|uniref:hypothetical protein n=1 Tax=Neotabrizicola sp. VNH66 TaxID=3400918 RepID=UPI003C024DD5
MCEACEARQKAARDAFLEWKIAEALGHVVLGAAEMIGLKEKPDGADLRGLGGRLDEGE